MVKCSKARHPTSGWPPRQAAAAQSLPSARWLWVWQGSTATGSAAPAYSGRCTPIRVGERVEKELLPHEPDRPEVPRKPRLDQVRIGQREVALHAPARTPPVADHAPPALAAVPDPHHRLPADRPLTPGRHGRVAAALHRVALEALVNGKTEDEWVARRESPFHLVHVLNQTLV